MKRLGGFFKTLARKQMLLLPVVAVFLLLSYQNCAKMNFATQDAGTIDLSSCSMAAMDQSDVSMSVTGFGLNPLGPNGWSELEVGDHMYLWLPSDGDYDTAVWTMEKDGGSAMTLGQGDQSVFPNPSGAGLTAGQYLLTIDLSKACDQKINGESDGLRKSESPENLTARIQIQFWVEEDVVYTCTGTRASNSMVCPSDAINLTANTAWTSVANAAACSTATNLGIKCQFYCGVNATLQGNACVCTNGANNPGSGCNQCTAPKVWNGMACVDPLVPVPGVCGVTRDTCSAGTFADLTDTSTHYRWICNGINNGANSSTCQAAIPLPPIAGVCGTSRDTCVAGSFVDLTDTSTHYQWRCNGQNNGANSNTCQFAIPLPPVVGACGTAHGKFAVAGLFPPGSLCSSGDAPIIPPSAMFAPTYKSTWTCSGRNGGGSADCEAYGYNVGNCGSSYSTCVDGTVQNANASAGTWTCRGAFNSSNPNLPTSHPGASEHYRQCAGPATCGAQFSNGPCQVQAYCPNGTLQSTYNTNLDSIIYPQGTPRLAHDSNIGPIGTFDVPGYTVIQADAAYRCNNGAWQMTEGRFCRVRKNLATCGPGGPPN